MASLCGLGCARWVGQGDGIPEPPRGSADAASAQKHERRTVVRRPGDALLTEDFYAASSSSPAFWPHLSRR